MSLSPLHKKTNDKAEEKKKEDLDKELEDDRQIEKQLALVNDEARWTMQEKAQKKTTLQKKNRDIDYSNL
jgi:enterochelin esterase-like enzyme